MKGSCDVELDFYLLIPYYNNFAGLTRSLRSVRYDPDKYALLIVDDGSREPLLSSYLSSFIPPSLAVEIIRLPENLGITRALNAGLHWLKDKKNFRSVARLDCGDLCADTRFGQAGRISSVRHPDIDLVGSWCIFKNFSSGIAYRYATPTEHKKIARGMYFRNIFIHPTVMWRASTVEKAGIYPENFPHAEDYGFFYEILSKGKAAVLPEDLVTCEITRKGLSSRFRMEQLKSRRKVVRQYGKNKLLRLMGVLKIIGSNGYPL